MNPPETRSSAQCYEKQRLAYCKALEAGMKLLSQDSYAPDRLSAIAAFAEACACTVSEDDVEDVKTLS
jgi:hypothetical protein